VLRGEREFEIANRYLSLGRAILAEGCREHAEAGGQTQETSIQARCARRKEHAGYRPARFLSGYLQA